MIRNSMVGETSKTCFIFNQSKTGPVVTEYRLFCYIYNFFRLTVNKLFNISTTNIYKCYSLGVRDIKDYIKNLNF